MLGSDGIHSFTVHPACREVGAVPEICSWKSCDRIKTNCCVSRTTVVPPFLYLYSTLTTVVCKCIDRSVVLFVVLIRGSCPGVLVGTVQGHEENHNDK